MAVNALPVDIKTTMQRTIIQKDASNIIKSFVERASDLQLKHGLTEGQLKELFLNDVLKLFLSQQFDVGTGIISNHKGEESAQTDLVIYDMRLTPPFIHKRGIGVYPVESVMATIEVKTTLGGDDFKKAAKDAAKLIEIYKASTLCENRQTGIVDPAPHPSVLFRIPF
jgi:hypothetical protein